MATTFDSDAPEGLDLVQWSDDHGGFVVQTGHTSMIVVIPMIFNDRIVEIQPGEIHYERFWCYEKGGSAILAAITWGGNPETEPTGWIKSYDQRYREPGYGQRGVDGKIVS